MDAQQQQMMQEVLMKQQEQANWMLEQLPADKRQQIEEVVNNYRNTLIAQKLPEDRQQTCLWTFYTQLVSKIYQDLASQASHQQSPQQQEQLLQQQLQQQQQQQLQLQQLQQQQQQQAQAEGASTEERQKMMQMQLQQMQQLQQQQQQQQWQQMQQQYQTQQQNLPGKQDPNQNADQAALGFKVKGGRPPLGQMSKFGGWPGAPPAPPKTGSLIRPTGLRGPTLVPPPPHAPKPPPPPPPPPDGQVRFPVHVRPRPPYQVPPPGAAGSQWGKNGTMTKASVPPPPPGGAKQFPPSMKDWLARLFHTIGKSDPALKHAASMYLKHWIAVWGKQGEIHSRDWDNAPLPTPDEIKKNVPPGTLSGRPGFAKASSEVPPRGFSGGNSSDIPRRLARRSRSRSRSRRSPRRRSPKRGRRRSSSSSSASKKSSSPSPTKSDKGKGRGKGRGRGRVSQEEMKEKVKVFLQERLKAEDWRGRSKDLADELNNHLWVGHKKFKAMFNMSVGQYIHQTLHNKKGSSMEFDSVPHSQKEIQKREDRERRFGAHLGKEPVRMLSFEDAEVPDGDGGPISGTLTDMCSREEAKDREMTRQLDKFEWKKGTDPKHAEANLKFATKKYQRSSADKVYKSSGVRDLDTCWRTMDYLMRQILDFDENPKPGYAVSKVSYMEVYSYLRDRTRAVRVDLHLQQPRSTTHRCFAETHECCLRFEMLSLFLLTKSLVALKSGTGSTEKYDQKLGLKAMSQTIEPLMNAYKAASEKVYLKNILAGLGGDSFLDDETDDDCYCSPMEMAMHRYVILLLMSFSSEGLLQHLAKLSKPQLSHPLVSFATQAYAAFNTEDYGKFLRLYRQADFLTAVAMSGIADLARVRALYLLLRTFPQPIGDKVTLARIKDICAFHSDEHALVFLSHFKIKVDLKHAKGPVVLFPKKGSPEATACPLLSTSRMPDSCDFPQGPDSMLISKYQALGMSRMDIVFGAADPVYVEAEIAPPEVLATGDADAMADASAAAAAAASMADALVAGSATAAVEAVGGASEAPAASSSTNAAAATATATASGAASGSATAASSSGAAAGDAAASKS